MRRHLLRASAISCTLLATTALTMPAQAQVAREHRNVDANSVDLTYGDFLPSIVEGSVGSGDAELQLVRDGVWVGGAFDTNGHQWDRIAFEQTPVSGGGVRWTVRVGSRFEQFSTTGTLPTGSSLTNGAAGLEYRTRDGTTIVFSDPSGGSDPNSSFCNGSNGSSACELLPVSIASPNGKSVAIEWDLWSMCDFSSGELSCRYEARIARVSNNSGYEIRFAYASNGSGGGSSAPPPDSWHQRTGATFHNTTVAGSPALGSTSYSYPSTGVTQVTDMAGRVWRFTGGPSGLTGIRRPGASSDTTTITGTPAAVTSVTRDGVTTSYSRSVAGSTATMVVTNALSQQTTVVSDLTIGRPTSVTNALGKTTSYQYDGAGRLTRVTQPEGNYTQYTLDARSNVTETRQVSKTPGTPVDIVTSASYLASCTFIGATCNKPIWTRDAKGNQTDYTYDTVTGAVLTVTAPAPTSGAARPTTTYSYTTVGDVQLLSGTSTCRTAASCTGTADEVKTTIGYNGNLLPTILTRAPVTAA